METKDAANVADGDAEVAGLAVGLENLSTHLNLMVCKVERSIPLAWKLDFQQFYWIWFVGVLLSDFWMGQTCVVQNFDA